MPVRVEPQLSVPEKMKPENASVFDPAWMQAARWVYNKLGLGDPNSAATVFGTPLEFGPNTGGILDALARQAPIRQMGHSLGDIADRIRGLVTKGVDPTELPIAPKTGAIAAGIERVPGHTYDPTALVQPYRVKNPVADRLEALLGIGEAAPPANWGALN